MMGQSITLNVRVTGPLSEFVSGNVGVDGPYENVSEYVRDLIRKDKERTEQTLLDRLKAELAVAFAAPDDTYDALSSEDIFARNRTLPKV